MTPLEIALCIHQGRRPEPAWPFHDAQALDKMIVDGGEPTREALAQYMMGTEGRISDLVETNPLESVPRMQALNAADDLSMFRLCVQGIGILKVTLAHDMTEVSALLSIGNVCDVHPWCSPAQLILWEVCIAHTFESIQNYGLTALGQRLYVYYTNQELF